MAGFSLPVFVLGRCKTLNGWFWKCHLRFAKSNLNEKLQTWICCSAGRNAAFSVWIVQKRTRRVVSNRTAGESSDFPSLLLLTGMLDWSCPGRRLKMETSNQCFSPWLLNKDNCEIRGRNCSWISSCRDRWVSHVAVKARGVWSEESPSCRQVSPKGEQWASNTRAEGLQQAVAVLGKGTAAIGVKTSEPSNLN